LSHSLEKNVCPIRFQEDNGMSTPISLPSKDSAEARPRSSPQTTSPTGRPRPWHRHRHFAPLNSGRLNKPRVLDNRSYHRAVSKPAQGASGALFLATVPLCFWITAFHGITPSLGIAYLGTKPIGWWQPDAFIWLGCSEQNGDQISMNWINPSSLPPLHTSPPTLK
jgi:hypothetical protein